MAREGVYRVFAEGDADGVPVAVEREGAEGRLGDAALRVQLAPGEDGPQLRFRTPAGELSFSVTGALAAAAALGEGGERTLRLQTPAGPVRAEREGDAWWVAPPEVRLLNWAQPAFAARVVTLDPLELDSRHLPGGVSVGLPHLVVPIERPEALARAEFALWRLRDLLPRLGADAVVAFAELPDRNFRLRAFPAAYGLPEGAGAGDGAAALAAWLADNDWFATGRVDARLEQGNPEGAPFMVRVQSRRLNGRLEVHVGGRVRSP